MELNIVESMKWRYATKKFDPNKKVSDKDIDELLEVLRLSASSYGLQPWKFAVVTDKDVREKLKVHVSNPSQITDSSHLIVLCAKLEIDKEHIKRFIAEYAKARNLSKEDAAAREALVAGKIALKGNAEKVLEWSKKQVYIALGTLLTACAVKRIDSCPMEGFDAALFDKVLGLKEKGLAAVVLCPVGYRSAEDHTSKLPKVRFGKEEVVLRI